MALLMSATDGVNGPPRTSGPGIIDEGKFGTLIDWSKFGVNGPPRTSGPGTGKFGALIDWSTAAGRLPVVKGSNAWEGLLAVNVDNGSLMVSDRREFICDASSDAHDVFMHKNRQRKMLEKILCK